MSGLGDFARKAEEWAGDNPEMTRKGIDQAEEFVQERTGHRFDDQISSGADKLADRLTGGNGDDNQGGYGSQDGFGNQGGNQDYGNQQGGGSQGGYGDQQGGDQQQYGDQQFQDGNGGQFQDPNNQYNDGNQQFQNPENQYQDGNGNQQQDGWQ